MRAIGKSVASVMRLTSTGTSIAMSRRGPLEEIDAELKTLEAEIAELLKEVVA